MCAIAAITQRALALPRMSAASSVPVPIGLVRISASPGRSPPLRSAVAAETSPLTAKPSASSAPSLVWPPTSAQPAVAQHLVGARHHRRQVGLDLGFEPVRHGGDRERGLRLAAHGVDVAERMIGGDLAEHVGVVDDGAEIVDGLHARAARRRRRPARRRRARRGRPPRRDAPPASMRRERAARARSRRPWRRSRRSAWRWRKSPRAPAGRPTAAAPPAAAPSRAAR